MSIEINKIYQGNALDVTKTFPDEFINCCITSPPYWGLRDYGTAKWMGGDMNCNHLTARSKGTDIKDGDKQGTSKGSRPNTQIICKKCGAVRVDDQLGLEKTPEEYVNNLVKLFHEVNRIMKPEGTLWLNLGDSYASNRKEGGDIDKDVGMDIERGRGRLNKHKIIKPKDLVGIPWMTAFALRADGWYLRSDIIWYKRNAMPESVADRPSKSHEYVFLMSKSPMYYYNSNSILEPYRAPMNRWGGDKLIANGKSMWDDETGQQTYRDRDMRPNPNGKNKRSVWDIPTVPFKDSQFATFPEALITPMIKAGCPKDGIVLDPFIGAGTTGLVAYNLHRNYIGIELNPEYVKMAEKRIKKVVSRGGLRLLS
jgi:DNA modification methylase